MRTESRLWFRVANLLEQTAYRMKDHACLKAQETFLAKYDLVDGDENPHEVTKYNYYQGVNILLLDRLVESGWIRKEDYLLDVGCGAGLFVFYMASRGFLHLKGQEMDRKLYRLALSNLESYRQKAGEDTAEIAFSCGNALELGVPQEITVAYLFNPFYDQATYEAWFACLEKSLRANPRRFHLILLYPTPASLSAIRKYKWLKEVDRFRTDTYVCSMCVHFRIYEADERAFLID